MKKIILALCVLIAGAFAQNQKPEFQAFAGTLMKFGNVKGGFQVFALEAKGEGWAFKAEGQVAAPAGDPYVLQDGALDGTVYAVVAYMPAVAAGTNGKDYQVGMFDLKVYLDDELQTTRNVHFTLLPPANDEWAQNMARDAAAMGAASKASLWNGANDVEITRTAAVPLDKKGLQPPPPKRVAPPPPAEPVVAPAPAPVVNKETDETPLEKKRRVVKKKRVVADEEEEEAPVVNKRRVVKKKRVVADEEEEAPVVKKRRVVKKKRVIVEEDDGEEEQLSIKEKRRRAAAKKRQKAAQFEDYED